MGTSSSTVAQQHSSTVVLVSGVIKKSGDVEQITEFLIHHFPCNVAIFHTVYNLMIDMACRITVVG